MIIYTQNCLLILTKHATKLNALLEGTHKEQYLVRPVAHLSKKHIWILDVDIIQIRGRVIHAFLA